MPVTATSPDRVGHQGSEGDGRDPGRRIQANQQSDHRKHRAQAAEQLGCDIADRIADRIHDRARRGQIEARVVMEPQDHAVRGQHKGEPAFRIQGEPDPQGIGPRHGGVRNVEDTLAHPGTARSGPDTELRQGNRRTRDQVDLEEVRTGLNPRGIISKLDAEGRRKPVIAGRARIDTQLDSQLRRAAQVEGHAVTTRGPPKQIREIAHPVVPTAGGRDERMQPGRNGAKALPWQGGDRKVRDLVAAFQAEHPADGSDGRTEWSRISLGFYQRQHQIQQGIVDLVEPVGRDADIPWSGRSGQLESGKADPEHGISVTQRRGQIDVQADGAEASLSGHRRAVVNHDRGGDADAPTG